MANLVQERTRLRGRPRQSEREVGRDKLIDQARKVIRLRPRTEIQRREIADVVGVTPALINYYFPDKWSLLEAASYPSIEYLLTTVEAILVSPVSTDRKFETLIQSYLTFHATSGYALEYYINASKNLNKKHNIDAIRSCRDKVCTFIREHHLEEVSDTRSAELVHATLWSVCECLGRLSARHLDSLPAGSVRHVDTRAYQPFVLKLFRHGVILREIA